MKARADHVIVIGGGHNGLTAAATLGKSGRKVTVLEARGVLGGLANGIEIAGRKATLYEDTSLVRPWVLESLDISLPRKPRATLVLPKKGRPNAQAGEAGEIRVDESSVAGAVSDADKAAYSAFRELMSELRPVLLGVLDRAPLSSEDSIWTLGRAAWSVRKLGKKTMMELVRVAPMCVADFLRDSFTNEHLQAGLAYGALEGAFTGPWSAHTALLLLMREALAAGRVDAHALIAALEATCKRHDVTLRTDAKVAKILVGADGVSGVKLASGEELAATCVLSTLDPKATLLEMIGAPWLPLAMSDSARAYRMRGATAIAVLALNGPLTTHAGTVVETLRTGETLDEVEKAFDAAKYKRFAELPALSVSATPDTNPIVTIRINAASYDLLGGWTEAARAACLEAALAQLARHCPTVRDQVSAHELLTPVDLEARFGLHGGHLLHGEHAPDQLLSFRPSIESGRYATPIPGLYLGGGASHPGGGLTAAPGALAARAILKS